MHFFRPTRIAPSIFLLSFILICSPLSPVRAQDTAVRRAHGWWNEGYPRWPRRNPKMKLLPQVSVYKNKFIDSKGDTLLFRGMSIADPDKIFNQGHWNKGLFEEVKKMGATLVR